MDSNEELDSHFIH